MSRRPLAALLLLGAVAACTTNADRHPAAYSLVGTWAYVDRQSQPRPLDICETDFGVTYSANGTFSGYEESGRWRVEGDHLYETVTGIWDMADALNVQRVDDPKSSQIRLEWISPNVVNLVGDDPAAGYGMLRCRAYDPGAATVADQ